MLKLPDPRWYQIAALGSLLTYGLARLDFEVSGAQVAVTLLTALVTQWACEHLSGAPHSFAMGRLHLPFEPRSALISALSLCLLLRTHHLGVAVLAAVLAVSSKFWLRRAGAPGQPPKHLLNPTNGALVILLALGLPMWVSPAQWGQTAWLGFAIACAGSVVVTRSARADVTFAFLASWCAIVFGRAAWLGQPWATPVHMLQNGGLLLFAFFMISDPRTTPDSRAGRIVYAALVALGAGCVQFLMYRTNGLLWSLVGASVLVPVIDRWLPGRRFTWDARARPDCPSASAPGAARRFDGVGTRGGIGASVSQ